MDALTQAHREAATGNQAAPGSRGAITVRPPIVVRDFAIALNLKPFQVIGNLMELNKVVSVSSVIEEADARKVATLMAEADMSARETGDSPVRLILAFEGDRSRFSAKNAMLSELTQALTGEAMPYATLMYVWSNHRAVDSVIVNPRTDRVRKMVVESGPGHLMQWRRYERDVRADFEKAFGEAPGALVGVAIMTDSDNTRGNVRAWYGDIRFD